MAVGRIKVAGMQTPWVGNAMLVLDGTEHRLGGFERIRCTEVEEEPTACRFQLKGKGVKVDGHGRRRAKDFVAWIYADPVGPEHNTLNCSISDLELDVELDGKPGERLTSPARPRTSSAPATPTTASRCSPTRTARRPRTRRGGAASCSPLEGRPGVGQPEAGSGRAAGLVLPPVPTSFALTILGETPRLTTTIRFSFPFTQSAELGLHLPVGELAGPEVVRRGAVVGIGDAAQIGIGLAADEGVLVVLGVAAGGREEEGLGDLALEVDDLERVSATAWLVLAVSAPTPP